MLLLAYVTTKISGAVFSGYILLNTLFGLGLWESVSYIILVTGAYTYFGGLRAVMLTDTFQCLFFIVGGFVGLAVAFFKVGGLPGLEDRLESCY